MTTFNIEQLEIGESSPPSMKCLLSWLNLGGVGNIRECVILLYLRKHKRVFQ